MNTHRQNNRKRARPSSNDDEDDDIDQPHKKQKFNPVLPNNQNNQTNTPPPPIPNVFQNATINTSPLEEHDEEEKSEETDHAIHSDKPTPSGKEEADITESTEPTEPPIIYDSGLGHLASGRKPDWFISKDVIINQLQQMQKKGSIPKDLQQQMKQYHERKKIVDNHIKNRANQIKSSFTMRSMPRPQIQPIITTNICRDTLQENYSEFEIETTWNCNVIICFICVIIFSIAIYALNIRFGFTNNIKYCDTDLCIFPLNTGEVIKCMDCPSFAHCENGIAKCKDDNDKLHPFKGCLPVLQYNKRVNGEMLYTQMYDFLKQRRRRYINCDTDTKYALSKIEMKHIFAEDKRNSGMNKSELKEAMEELFGNILLEDFAQEVIFNVSSENKTYYANLPEWEVKSSMNCSKMNILLLAKTYGLELSVSVVCVTALLVSWRQVSMMVMTLLRSNYMVRLNF